MSKKTKIPSQLPVAELSAKADRLLAEGHHKEAIEAYKQLLKTEARRDWQTALATAYLERAKTLAQKNMYKEAAALWETRASLCQDEGARELYVLWLIRANRYGRAAQLYVKYGEQLPDNEVTRQLLPLLGAQLLVGQSEVADQFPADSLLGQQCAIVKAAIQAYCQGQDEAVENYLKQIPFRSPYRDFRPLLKSLLLWSADSLTVDQWLEKIPVESPYRHLADLVNTGYNTANVDNLNQNLNQLTPVEQAFLGCLKGWQPQQLKLISQLQAAIKQGAYHPLFDTIVAHQDLFGLDYARQTCLAMLPVVPALSKDYEKVFGVLSEFDRRRLDAFLQRQHGNSQREDTNWGLAVEALKRELDKGDNALKVAFILRYRAEQASRHGADDGEVINYLTESLDYDPTHQPTYLNLIHVYQQNGLPQEYRQWVEAAVKQFPNDSAVLTLAMESATQRQAFKKALGFAKKLLAVDPINIKARQTLLSSHLSHARKLIKTKKFELARQELTEAARLEKTNQRSGLVSLNQGLLALAENAPVKSAKELILAGFQQAGGSLRAYLRVLVETKSLNLKLDQQVLTWLPEFKRQYVPSRSEVLEVIDLMNFYHGNGLKGLLKMLTPLESPLQKAIEQEFSTEEMISICQGLKQIGHYGLLKPYAKAALQQWPTQPVFVFYDIVAKVAGKPYALSQPQAIRLKEAQEQAETLGDKRTQMMITEFLMTMAQYVMPRLTPEELLENLEEEGMDDLSPEESAELLEMVKQLVDFSSPKKGRKKPKGNK